MGREVGGIADLCPGSVAGYLARSDVATVATAVSHRHLQRDFGMKPWVIAVLGALLLAGYGFGMFKWGVWHTKEAYADEGPWIETVRETVLTFPPAMVAPNPAHATPRPDLTDRRRVDSLIASNANKDSLINALSEAQFIPQAFRTAKDSTTIVGRLEILYFPLDRVALTDVFVDSLTVPERVITIIKTVETVRIDWGWMVAGVAVGVVAGGIAVWGLAR